ncbi:MAG: hypothetical protein DRP68_04620 [Candidatus Omnitrophota bacterium]|nr:MAG: hypothetical protein DRP68_04620 [Candidatus Omnitrophota bacterium]RKY38324.1 MAG: hypothetical protein DRP72_01985 [Candidatus Omnitrophota bacterium]RKY45361.1 MAG: hypothetical protein DRP81_04025 [Candidatus Omnitrophota bacterium]HDN86631.1 hypothetical protein [Candidatus Omnitrophota bacterium]
MIALGVDVGLRTTAYAVCRVNGSRVKPLNDGQINTFVSFSLPQRLALIFNTLSKVIEEFRPQVLILEKLYSHYRHPTTLGLLAQVRGVVALLSDRYNLKFYEYSPTQAKKAILGRGDAKAPQVKKMVENMLSKKVKSQHIADAYSLVITYSHQVRIKRFYD